MKVVPFPQDPETFRHVSERGEALRRLHLVEDAAIGETPFPFEGEGDSLVDKPQLEGGKVWINKDQGFAGVSQTAWEFHIGGYQPAQKWLKDRRGRDVDASCRRICRANYNLFFLCKNRVGANQELTNLWSRSAMSAL